MAEGSQLDRYNRGGIGRWYWDCRDREVLKHLGDGPILDIGCGEMITTRKIPAAVGMDLFQGDVLGSVYSIPYPSNHFGTVLLLEVIEHLKDPLAALLEIRRVLKPGGRLVMLFPNDVSFRAAWFLTGMWGEIFRDRGHIWQLTPDHARLLLNMQGFRAGEGRNIPFRFWCLSLHHIIVGVKC